MEKNVEALTCVSFLTLANVSDHKDTGRHHITKSTAIAYTSCHCVTIPTLLSFASFVNEITM